jgi:pimeloyl-ACP methyl ester carboxylesterase
MFIKIAGTNQSKPALLLVNGAGFALSRMAEFFAPWESAFRLVYWDQPTSDEVTFDTLTDDGLAVAEELRARHGIDRTILLGISGGSIVGLKMVKARPNLFSAYIGTGQVIRGCDVTESTEGLVFTPAEQAALAGMPRDGGDQRATATRMYEQLRETMTAFEARALGVGYDLPIYFIQGELDRYTPTARVAAFVEEIVAPVKKLVVVEGGGHAVMFMREEFLRALKLTVDS